MTFAADTSRADGEDRNRSTVISAHRVFELDRHVVFPNAAVTGAAPVLVETPSGRWAYAISFLPEWPSGADGIDGLIRVQIRVLNGEVSLLSLAAEETRVIDETYLPACGRIVEANLAATPLSSCRRLVLRNAGETGSSAAEIYSIDHVRLGEAERGDILTPPPDLSLKPIAGWDRYYGRRGLTLDERLRSARYALLDGVKTMPWVDALELLIRPNEELSRAVYVSGTYEPASLIAMKRLLPRGGTVFDVGANVGIYSMLASRWVDPGGRVFAFEPSEREFLHLREQVEHNRLANVTAIRMAVSDREGALELRVAKYPYAGQNTTGEKFVYDGVTASHTERVEATTLDRFASDARLERLDLVKVDVDGEEQAVLAGASALLHGWRPSWIIEVSPEASSGRVIPESLNSFYAASYRVFRLDAATALFSEFRSDDSVPFENLVAVPAEREIPIAWIDHGET